MEQQAAKSQKRVVLALDWTPNTNHTGIYVARAKGFYSSAGLELVVDSPHIDDYKDTPAQKLKSKVATFAIVPKETIISFHTYPAEAAMPKIQAVASLHNGNDSYVCTLKSSGLDKPAMLDGKAYASYGARYEGRIVQKMIMKDGGKGEFNETTPEMLGIWNTLLQGKADATWIFRCWEGIEAKQSGVELNMFKMEDYGVPYGQTMHIVALPETLSEDKEMVKAFLKATQQGYEYAAANSAEAANILVEQVASDTEKAPLPKPLEAKMVMESQEYVGKLYLDSKGRWGTINTEAWAQFIEWLKENGLLTSMVQSREPEPGKSTSLDGLRAGDVGDPVELPGIAGLVTNEYLPEA